MSINLALLDWRILAVILVLFGLAPGIVLRQVVRLYPKGHPRRAELMAELYVRPYVERPLYVAQSLETSFTEGIPARRRLRHLRTAVPELADEGHLDHADEIRPADIVLVTDNQAPPQNPSSISQRARLELSPDVHGPQHGITILRHLRALLLGLMLGAFSHLGVGIFVALWSALKARLTARNLGLS